MRFRFRELQYRLPSLRAPGSGSDACEQLQVCQHMLKGRCMVRRCMLRSSAECTHQHVAAHARALHERHALGGFGRLQAVDTRRPRRAQGWRCLHLLFVTCGHRLRPGTLCSQNAGSERCVRSKSSRLGSSAQRSAGQRSAGQRSAGQRTRLDDGRHRPAANRLELV